MACFRLVFSCSRLPPHPWSRFGAAPAVVCSFECEPQGVFEGDVKGGPDGQSRLLHCLTCPTSHEPRCRAACQ